VRFPVDWLAGPPCDSEEEPDTSLAFRVAVMDDVAENEVAGIDTDPDLLTGLADSTAGNRFPGLQMPRRGAQLTVGITGT
jgi:hypothetical protein